MRVSERALRRRLAGGSWRRVENLVLVTLLGLGLYLLVPRFVGDRRMLDVLGRANLLAIPAALLVETVSMLCVCCLYYEVLRLGGERRLSFGRVAKIYMSAYAFGHIVPGANAGTFYLSYRELRREELARSTVVKTLAVSNIFYSAAILVLLLAGLVLSLARGNLPYSLRISVLAVTVGAFLFVLCVIALFRRPESMKRLAVGMLRLLQRLRLARQLDAAEVGEQTADVRSYILSIVRSRRKLLRAGLPALGFWLFDLACCYTIFLGIGHPVKLGVLLICYAVADVMASIPTTPAGLGVFEITLGAGLYAFGIPAEVLAIGILGFRFFSFWLPIPAGGICYLLLRADRRREARQSA
ncbi:MAG: lysylphosphatidylglycerol synthase transmembrane domain-containing protein [Candidatus Geothermincolia bacterium]